MNTLDSSDSVASPTPVSGNSLNGAVCASLVATLAHGPAAMYGLITVGLFTSIMFPTIFALAIRGLGPLTEEGSGLLILSIAGGALVFINGKVADHFGINWAFLITALGGR